MDVFSSYLRDGYSINLRSAGKGELVFRQLWYEPVTAGVTGEPKGEVVSKTRVPIGRWACWEWEIAGVTNEQRFWLDGQEVTDMRIGAAQGWTAPRSGNVTVGWDAYHGSPTIPDGFDIWFDEIAVASDRIGCAT
jgi:hypothetical protein